MESKEKILVVVPCYNEAGRLPLDLFSAFIQQEDHFDFLFVNDGSTDQTAQVLEENASRFPNRFFFLNLHRNQGKAEAVRQGMLHHQKNGVYDFFAFLDADLATPLSEIQFMIRFKNFIGGDKKFIFGSRVKLLGSHIERDPLRHYFGRISATGASISLNLPVYDTQCGVKLFHHSVVEPVFQNPFTSRWLFDVEIFFRFKSLYSEKEFYDAVLEVPIRTWKDIPGTKIKLTDIFKVPFELYRIYRRYARHSNF